MGLSFRNEMSSLITDIISDQEEDGSYRFCFENSLMTDAYTIILWKALQIKDNTLVGILGRRIKDKQQKNGAWRLFKDEQKGNLSATVEAYYALIYAGICSKDDPSMQKAASFIKENGGLDAAGTMTKVMLASTGQLPWSSLPFAPIEAILIPNSFPISFYDFSGYARVHLAPMLLLRNTQYVLKHGTTPDLSDLITIRTQNSGEDYRVLNMVKDAIGHLKELPEELEQRAFDKAEAYMLARIEPNGLLYSYFSCSFFMILALLAKGYSKKDSIITNALQGIVTLLCHSSEKSIHVQNSSSTVWDTALLTSALIEADVEAAKEAIDNAQQYLQSRQHFRYGDWSLHNPSTLPGGFGFSDINTMQPDIDDTTASLIALYPTISNNPKRKEAWNRGLKWVLSMQNRDGGWPAFEKNTDKQLLTLVPMDGAEAAAIDPSTADLTGRTLYFLSAYANLPKEHPSIQKAIRWLREHQRQDGSWYGRWGVCYIYGTWAAITGLMASKLSPTDPTIQRAKDWLLSIQNLDNGWGESCYSDVNKLYTPLHASTPSHTSWALDALISIERRASSPIDKGMSSLLTSLQHPDWTHTYPTGAGLPGFFYIYYHSYNKIWPLKTLAHYQAKYVKGKGGKRSS
ncbi:squalene--hopene cyclase [Pontibacillus salicampi]|uniref:Squalene--hopene cyclase n=1 Tax=Pontibacillus salicampi TaxID=1449801 RepID=A0ABV6LR34_9BACI